MSIFQILLIVWGGSSLIWIAIDTIQDRRGR
jgi:hypothetical protein